MGRVEGLAIGFRDEGLGFRMFVDQEDKVESVAADIMMYLDKEKAAVTPYTCKCLGPTLSPQR